MGKKEWCRFLRWLNKAGSVEQISQLETLVVAMSLMKFSLRSVFLPLPRHHASRANKLTT
jgi:hypothetical protein